MGELIEMPSERAINLLFASTAVVVISDTFRDRFDFPLDATIEAAL